MVRRIVLSIVPLALLTSPAFSADLIGSFTGSGPGRTSEFTVDGPWRIDWEATSATPLTAAFYTDLIDVENARHLGYITQVRGTGTGSVLVEQGGTFRIGVSGCHADWQIDVVELSQAEAAALEPAAAGEAPAQPSRLALRPPNMVAAGSFSGWRAVAADRLELATADADLVLVVQLTGECPGLQQSEKLLFVTPASGATDMYDSVLLDDGTQCYFASVSPQYR